MMNAATKRNVEARLKRVGGQIGALLRMVEQDDYCVDILLQISAAQGALGKVGEIILGSHIQTCVSDAFEHGTKADRQQKVEELMNVFARYSRIGAR
jgi:DNA-binding FrmR family transcriptional regulator